MNFRPMVFVERSWSGNALVFATREEAEANVRDLASRWTLVEQTRVDETDEPVNYRYIDGRLEQAKAVVDLYVQNEGSIFLLRGVSDAGKAWIEEHIPGEAQHFGGAVVVEHRFIADIVAGATEDGLEVE